MYYVSNSVGNSLLNSIIPKIADRVSKNKSVKQKIQDKWDSENSAKWAVQVAFKDTSLQLAETKDQYNILRPDLDTIPKEYIKHLQRGTFDELKIKGLSKKELGVIQSRFNDKYHGYLDNVIYSACWDYIERLLKIFGVIVVCLGVLTWGGFKIYNHVHLDNLNKQAVSQNNATTSTQVGSVYTISLPCDAKVTQVTSGTLVGYDGSCNVVNSSFAPQYLYQVDSNDFVTSQYGSTQTDYAYCTAQTSYTDSSTGDVSYVVDPHTEVINGITYSECGLSDSQDGLYSVVGTAIDPNNSNEDGQITVSYAGNGQANANTLWSSLANVLSTVSFQ